MNLLTVVLMVFMGDKVVGGIPKIGKGENVFNGGTTTGGRMDKWRPQLDSARQIGLRRVPHEVLRVLVDAPTGGEICGAELRR